MLPRGYRPCESAARGGGQWPRVVCAAPRTDCDRCRGSAGPRPRAARWRHGRFRRGCNSRDRSIQRFAGAASGRYRWSAVRSVYRARRVRQGPGLRPSRCPTSADRSTCVLLRQDARAGDPGPPRAARTAHPRSEQITRRARQCADCPGANLLLGWGRSDPEAILARHTPTSISRLTLRVQEHDRNVLNLTLRRPGAWASFRVKAAPGGIDAKFGQQIDQYTDWQANDIKITAINALGWLERRMLDAVCARLIKRVAGSNVGHNLRYAVVAHQD